jgi:hypothetical protein
MKLPALPDAPNYLESIRWIEVRNASGAEAPGWALAEITGSDSDGTVVVNKPSADNMRHLVILSPEGLSVGGKGLATFAQHVPVTFDPAGPTPAINEEWGSAANSWFLTTAKTGYKIHADENGYGQVEVVRPEGIPPKTTDYAVLNYGLAADPDDRPRWLSSPSVNTWVARTSAVCGVPEEIDGNLFFYNDTNANYLRILAATFSETQTMTLPAAAPTSAGMVLKNGPVTSGSYATGWDFVDAPEVTYTPAVSGDWSGSPPTTVKQALDRIAAALGPIA